jgi:ADP-ribose pyrophosphatase
MEDSQPLRVISRSLVCENTKFHIYFDHVVDSVDHSEVLNYLVVAPKLATANLVTGVAILPIIKGHIGLIKIYRPAIRSFSWEIPHGFVEEGESEKISASRELLEEAGLFCKPEDFTSLGQITPDAGVLAARIHLYYVEGIQEIN